MSRGVSWLLMTLALLALPVTGYAQEAVLTGTVTDTTGGVLPGVTVTAVHEATGNTFVGVSDEQRRLPDPRAHRHLSPDRGAVGLHHRVAHGADAARRPDGQRGLPDGRLHAAGNRDRHRRGAADRRDHVRDWRQHR